MLGIIQEQHPDRCRLFMQWKQMDWPILIDPLNLLDVSAVPLTYLIDEHGIVRKARARPDDLEDFLAQSYPAPDRPDGVEPDDAASQQRLTELLKEAEEGEAGARRRLADYLVLWGQERDLDQAIRLYRSLIEDEPDNGRLHFRLGVALRKRFDSPSRQRGDFADAVEAWGRALELDPNQYIWRRRIQQYGPRLDKPYPFYDWVKRARREIVQRGQQPLQLSVEPGGAEFAQPSKDFQQQSAAGQEPDPRGRIYRDQRGLVQSEQAVVPARPEAGQSVRVHIIFRPNPRYKAHWNNEVEDLIFWVDAPAGWKVDRRYHRVERPPKIVSQEPRTIEFEVQIPKEAGGRFNLEAYALYYVCEDVDGTCLYRRHDLVIPVRVR